MQLNIAYLVRLCCGCFRAVSLRGHHSKLVACCRRHLGARGTLGVIPIVCLVKLIWQRRISRFGNVASGKERSVSRNCISWSDRIAFR